MGYEALRTELRDFYWERLTEQADAFKESCVKELDGLYKEGMTVWQEKALQYRVISERFEPVLFDNSPFYYELGTMWGQCDGARDFRGHSHAGGWTYWKNAHRFAEQDEDLWKLRCAQAGELLYLICGPYNDVSQHFTFNFRPILQNGLSGLMKQAENALKKAETEKERAFLETMSVGIIALKRIAEKFSEAAAEKLKTETEPEKRKNLEQIRDSAAYTPWERPRTFYEALNTYALLRKSIGALEGVGNNCFGRIDMDLEPFYRADIEAGRLTKEEAYDLIAKFLITFDMHYDHDMKMVKYADHEMENTLVLGGCDADGKPFYNEITELFLRAGWDEKIIYPKFKCRYSSESPKAYLDAMNEAVIHGTSSILYQNDEACIPAHLRAGRTLEEARDYIISGCWDMSVNGAEKADCGSYLNLLKPFEFSIHALYDKIEKVGIPFKVLTGNEDFEEIYRITIENARLLLEERIRITRLGGQIWDTVDVLPLFSSTLGDCIEERRDFTSGGGRYRDDQLLMFGLPNIVDSLLAIRTLCFEKKVCTFEEYLHAVRENWVGYESLRLAATRCHGWGDGSEEAGNLANRLNNDLYAIASSMTGTYGGKVLIGHLTYTEIRWWGEKTLATPDGRRSGEYFAQGLTPSRLKQIPSVTSVIHNLASLDPSTLGSNSVVNIILPAGKTTLAVCEAFLRTAAHSAMQSLQLNCTSKEELLDAQKHPEKYPNLIVRVTGFSARFTSLSPEWQQEVLTRNFYD